MWKLLGIIINYNKKKNKIKPKKINNNDNDTPAIRRYQQRVWSAAVESLTVSLYILDKATKTKQQNELNRLYAENVLM